MPIRLTAGVKYLLIACVALFVVQQAGDRMAGGVVTEWLGLVPGGFLYQFRIWQLVTYSFLHGEVFHLFFNMLMLVFFGSEIEAAWGMRRFLQYYFLCVVGAGLFYLLLQLVIWQGMSTPLVGASGGIFGLLVAYGLIFGERTMLFMMLFPMKAKQAVWVFAAIEFFSTVFSGRQGLSNAAHLGGMVVGFLFLTGGAWIRVQRKLRSDPNYLRAQRLKRKKVDSQHLKLVINNPKDARRGSGGPLPDEDPEGSGPKTWH